MSDLVKQEILKIINKKKRFYQPVRGFPQCTNRAIEKFTRRINDIINFCDKGNKFLIGGCSNGFNAFELAKLKKSVVAVDHLEVDIKFCKLLAKYYGINEDNPLFIHSEILNYLKNTKDKYDYCLLLMVLHHILDYKNTNIAFELCNLMMLKSKYSIIAIRYKERWKEELGIKSAEYIPDYFIQHTDFTHWEKIIKRCNIFKIPIYLAQ